MSPISLSSRPKAAAFVKTSVVCSNDAADSQDSVNKALLVARIAELAKDKKIEGISDLRDESDRHGMRIVIELKRDATPRKVLNNL